MSPRDGGGATVWVLAAGSLTLTVAMASAAAGAAILARHRAHTAADFGALAAATRVIEGPGVACARAAEIVAHNGARMVGCDLNGFDVVVSVEVTPAGVAAAAGVATATARAGPA